jgi:hypothetical protein
MHVRERFRRWFGSPSRESEGGMTAGAPRSAAVHQSRRRAITAGDRASLWTEEPETCEVCGRRLLTGELPALVERNDESLLVCPVCVMELATVGFRSPSPQPDRLQHGPGMQRDAA